MTTPGRIHLELEDDIATVIIDRPDKRNALTPFMRARLLEAIQRADDAIDIRVIKITGKGRAFCAGGDIHALATLKQNNDEAGFIRLLDDGKAIVDRLRNSSKPTIAVVNGPALGAGLFIALGCDLRLCAESASFGIPLVKMGLGPDWGGTYTLPRLVGGAVASEMLFTGMPLSAQDAVRLGLANHIYPDAELRLRAMAMAREIAAYPAALLTRYKHGLRATLEQTYAETAELERRLQLLNFHSPEFAVGLAKVLERHAPAAE